MRSLKAFFCVVLATSLLFGFSRPAHALSVVNIYDTNVYYTIEPGETRPIMFNPPGGHPKAVTATITQIGAISSDLTGRGALLRQGQEYLMKNVAGVATQTISYAYWYADPAMYDLLILQNKGTTPIIVIVKFTGHF
ncbi:hypothetical protein [Gorillibacterium sp. CAU 1737]|uniref:hypothetical protein n=1 Tax=Gorillibacterium sp. CAU 1737 TaxID=3140362 RepID=UPI003260BC12